MAQLRIATTRQQDLQALAAAGQTTVEAWRTLHKALSQLSPAHAFLLAEPVANEARGEVDWYADGDGTTVLLRDLPEPERAAAQARMDALVADIEALAQRLNTSRADGERFLADMLGLALRLPGPEYVYVQGEQPILVGWGHVRSGGRGGEMVLTGLSARAVAATAILPPPPSPYAAAAPPRMWLWGVLGASLLAPLLAAFILLQDPFGWFTITVAPCRLQPGQLGLARGIQEEAAREGVLRAELARLLADAGERRVQCPPEQPPPPPPEPPRPPPPAPPPAPPPSQDAQRAERQGAQRGRLQVILAWDDRNDLDLQVTCPNGTSINFIRRQFCGGRLDVDANGDVDDLTTTPVENVFFDAPQPGRYRVVVDPYGMRARNNTPFRVTIRREGQPDEVTNGTAVNGQRNRMVVQFTVDAPSSPPPATPPQMNPR